MSRRLGFRILLSLLLLFTQQLALTHVLSHLGTAGGVAASAVAADDDGSDSDSAAKLAAHERVCHECLALSQIVPPLGQAGPTFLAVQAQAVRIGLHSGVPSSAPSYSLFQSRAPPLG